MLFKLYCYICVSITLILFYLLLAANFGISLFSNKQVFSGIVNILPQGWGFFTKDARDVRVQVIRYSDGEYQVDQNFKLNNYLGIGNENSRKVSEIGYVVKNIPDSLWRKRFDLNFRLDSSKFIPIKSNFAFPLLKGEYIVYYHQRTPWAWSKFEEKMVLPIIYVKVNIL